MKVLAETIEQKEELELGDVIQHGSHFYLVAKLDDTYFAKNFNGNTGLFGKHDSMTELNEEFLSRRSNLLKEAVIYKATDYTLQLVKNK